MRVVWVCFRRSDFRVVGTDRVAYSEWTVADGFNSRIAAEAWAKDHAPGTAIVMPVELPDPPTT